MELKEVLLAILLILVSLNIVSAIDLEIEKKVISEVIIAELDEPATFWFTIKNLGQTDRFELYSLVDVEMEPKSAFRIESGQFKKIKVEVKAGNSVKRSPGYFNFVYKIKGSGTEKQEDTLRIKITNLEEAIEIEAESINPESEKATINIKNKEDFNFGDIEAEFSSVFFDFKETFSLNALEEKSFSVDLGKDKLKTLMAGPYILDTKIKIGEVEKTMGSTIDFLEKEGISTKGSKKGFLIVKEEIEKINEGNLPTLTEVTVERSMISSLFTTLTPSPIKTERKNMNVLYTWQQELRPGESLNIVVRTNWLIPLIILVAIIVLIILYRLYLTSDIILKKKIGLVKTKGGEFALKVSINVKAKKYVEKIHVIDKLPALVKLYKRYGTITPDRIDEKKRKVEWNIESLDKGESKIISYIIYSKIGVIGKFELPAAKAVYDKEGKIKETESNRVFFVSEPEKIKKED